MYWADTGVPSSCVSGVFLSVEPGKNWKSKMDLGIIWRPLSVCGDFAHRAIGCVFGPGHSVHTVLEFKLGDPVVILRTTLDYYSRYFPNLVQIDLDPA